MNLKLINRVIASYNETLNESDKARLEFFRGLWEEMQRWMESPVAAVKNYELPSKEALIEAWNNDEPVFSYAPSALSKDRLGAIFNSLRSYVVDSGVLPKEDTDQLAKLDGGSLFTHELTDQAAKNPEAFLNEFYGVVQEKSNETVARSAVMLALLSLRVDFEPIAKQLSELFPKGDDCHHNPLRCPVCGSAPALAKVGGDDSPTDGRGKSLYCQQCGCVWDFERIRCARCGTRNQGHLHYFNIEGDDGHRIATCDECGNYTRTIFIEEALRPFSFEVEEVVTARLDAIAHDPRFQADEKDA